ncbi:hypothetical protein U9M48_044298 [Paspalum notatum var. saurae]|uniref:No apical meristem-associated C-terminal domain-containing protein n=1 Tax=Paspalum notatum var. saurae TaxID=547442 RepID=A0AAQ3UUZ2_PASNO
MELGFTVTQSAAGRCIRRGKIGRGGRDGTFRVSPIRRQASSLSSTSESSISRAVGGNGSAAGVDCRVGVRVDGNRRGGHLGGTWSGGATVWGCAAAVVVAAPVVEGRSWRIRRSRADPEAWRLADGSKTVDLLAGAVKEAERGLGIAAPRLKLPASGGGDGGCRGFIRGELHRPVLFQATSKIESMADGIAKLRQALLDLVRGVDRSSSTIRAIVGENFDPARDPSDPFNDLLATIEDIANELDQLVIQCNEVIKQHDEDALFHEIDLDDVVPANYASQTENPPGSSSLYPTHLPTNMQGYQQPPPGMDCKVPYQDGSLQTLWAASNFADLEGHPFGLLHCWDLLKDEPKWRDPPEQHEDRLVEEVSHNSNKEGKEGEKTIGKRPMGRDRAKANNKRSKSVSGDTSSSEYATRLQDLSLQKISIL